MAQEDEIPLPFDNAETIGEIAGNDIVSIHNRRVRGEISFTDASEQMDEVEKARVLAGDGWFDRYGPPSDELLYLYPESERYWERTVEERLGDNG